jgi:hypothetical protein
MEAEIRPIDDEMGIVFKRKPQRIGNQGKIEEVDNMPVVEEGVKKFIPVVEVIESSLKRDECPPPKAVRITEIISLEDSPVIEEYHGRSNVASPSSPQNFTDVSATKQRVTVLLSPKISEAGERREEDAKRAGRKEEEMKVDGNKENNGESVGKFQENTPKRKKRRKKKEN